MEKENRLSIRFANGSILNSWVPLFTELHVIADPPHRDNSYSARCRCRPWFMLKEEIRHSFFHWLKLRGRLLKPKEAREFVGAPFIFHIYLPYLIGLVWIEEYILRASEMVRYPFLTLIHMSAFTWIASLDPSYFLIRIGFVFILCRGALLRVHQARLVVSSRPIRRLRRSHSVPRAKHLLAQVCTKQHSPLVNDTAIAPFHNEAADTLDYFACDIVNLLLLFFSR